MTLWFTRVQADKRSRRCKTASYEGISLIPHNRCDSEGAPSTDDCIHNGVRSYGRVKSMGEDACVFDYPSQQIANRKSQLLA